MSRFISGPVNWLRRSFSEHDGGLNNSNSNSSNTNTSDRRESAPNEGTRSKYSPRFASSFDEENLTPTLIYGGAAIGTILALHKSSLTALSNHFPSRILGSDLVLSFSTTTDGFSLASLYRRLAKYRDGSPALLVLQDTHGNTFGALVSEPFKVQESFYGTGQSFLFRLTPDFRVWPWSTENDFFISCSSNSLRIGAGDGHFGLSIDGDLNHGRTQRCATYNNDPLVDSEDFVIQSLEIWTFSS